MYPVLFNTVNTYGVCLLTGLIIGVWVFFKLIKSENFTHSKLISFLIILYLSSSYGSRLFYMFFEYKSTVNGTLLEPPFAFFSNPLACSTDVFYGGLSSFGGILIPVFLGLLLYKRFGFSFKIFDVLIITIGISIGFGRIGCTFAGCCFGLLTDPDNLLALDWEKCFSNVYSPVCKHYISLITNPDCEDSIKYLSYVWPTQIMFSINGFLLSLLAYFSYDRYYKRKLNIDKKLMFFCYTAIIVFLTVFIMKYFESSNWSSNAIKAITLCNIENENVYFEQLLTGFPIPLLLGMIIMLSMLCFSVLQVIKNKLYFNGMIFILGGMYYSCTCFILESIRGSIERIFSYFTYNHLICILIMLCLVVFLFIKIFPIKKRETILSND